MMGSQAGGLSAPLGALWACRLRPPVWWQCQGHSDPCSCTVAKVLSQRLCGCAGLVPNCHSVPQRLSVAAACLPLIMCAGFIFSSNLFQQMQSGCARRWAGYSAAARAMEPGFIVRPTGMTCLHPHDRYQTRLSPGVGTLGSSDTNPIPTAR